MLLEENEIRELCQNSEPLLYPLVEKTKGGKISFGLSHIGYDVRLGTKFVFFTGPSYDPKNESMGAYHKTETEDRILLNPNTTILGESIERFNLPTNIAGVGHSKTTYTRCGVGVDIPPLEPGWSGKLTISIQNKNSYPVYIYPQEGIAQITFYRLQNNTSQYAGRYQAAEGIVLSGV